MAGLHSPGAPRSHFEGESPVSDRPPDSYFNEFQRPDIGLGQSIVRKSYEAGQFTEH